MLVFKLRGSLDLATAPSVKAALTEATDSGPHDIIVDLTQFEFSIRPGWVCSSVRIGEPPNTPDRFASSSVTARSLAS